MKSFGLLFFGLYLVVGFAVWQGAVACGGASSGTYDGGTGPFAFENNIFTRTTRLEATAIANVAGEPNFSWPAIGAKHVVCAIFSERIQTKQDRITNLDRLVWVWHTGLGKGREGNVLYEHGVPNANSTEKPKPLPKGNYYWGVWAFNEEGTPIRSTIEYTLQIQ